MIYPQNFEQKIGFDTIRQLVSGYCLSSLGKGRVEDMAFMDSLNNIKEKLEPVAEFIKMLEAGEAFPDQYFFDVRDSLKRVRLAGTYLDEQELFDLRRSLETILLVVSFVNRTSGDAEDAGEYLYPALHRVAGDVMTYPQLIKRVDSILDKYGRVKDSASPELLRIRQELSRTAGSVSKSLQSILRSAQADGLVDKDVAPTLRDGRLVIPVAPAMKRRIKGIVHDESATGKTVFIEPAEVVEANNRIRELEGEEKREIIHILTQFSQIVREHVDGILSSFEFLADIDFIRAKAYFARSMNAVIPECVEEPKVDWIKAKHPLLLLSLANSGRDVVPLDIRLDKAHRILIISGPNAGGKSVCLKTVALLQYMVQCGLPITVDANSTVGVFQHLFIDMGDEQSIENDLSTYSSHLLNMKVMMKQCNGKSLVMVDEFGSGTEPMIGGAMAESVLRRFNAKKAFGVITTHYQNLKHFAEDNEGVVNGAMLYDRKEMKALFQLEIGNPGSSFAVEIARKIGIPEDVIADASAIVGQEYINADKYLQDIVRDKRYWEHKRQNVHQREKQLEQTIAKYEAEIAQLNAERKSILKEAKEQAASLLKESNARIENTIRSIKEAQAEQEKTRNARQELEEFKENVNNKEAEDKIARKMQQLIDRQNRKNKRKEDKQNGVANKPQESHREASPRIVENKPFLQGDTVRIKGQTTVGVLAEVNGKNAIVNFGSIRTNVKIDRLEHASKPKDNEPKSSTFVSLQTQDSVYEKKLNFKQDIDLRGMRGDEAVNAVTYFIDDAIMLGSSRVRILHGTGTGILRNLIREYLATVPGVRSFRDEHVQFGGAGITVVELDN